MARFNVIDLMACVDCGLFLANGEIEGCDPSWAPENMTDEWDNPCNGDSEKDDEFSWRACDLCGSRLGGARMHCVALVKPPRDAKGRYTR